MIVILVNGCASLSRGLRRLGIGSIMSRGVLPLGVKGQFISSICRDGMEDIVE